MSSKWLSLLGLLLISACTSAPAGCGTPLDIRGVWTQSQTVTESNRVDYPVGRILTGDFTITMDGDKVTASPPNPANAASGTICGDKVRLTRTGTENGVGFEVVADSVYTLTTFTVTATRTFADGTVVKFSGSGSKKP